MGTRLAVSAALWAQTIEDWGEDTPESLFGQDLLDYATILFLALGAGVMIWRRLR